MQYTYKAIEAMLNITKVSAVLLNFIVAFANCAYFVRSKQSALSAFKLTVKQNSADTFAVQLFNSETCRAEHSLDLVILPLVYRNRCKGWISFAVCKLCRQTLCAVGKGNAAFKKSNTVSSVTGLSKVTS